MKKTSFLITSLFFLLPFIALGQINFYRLCLGFGGGITQNQGDLSQPQSKELFQANADYYFTPYIHSGLEVQSGKIYGQENQFFNRFYQNHYKALLFSTKIHLGQFMSEKLMAMGGEAVLKKAIKGIYSGAGLGVIMNKQQKIYREENNASTLGADKNSELIIPVALGIDNSGFHSRFVGGLAYQAHFALGDQLDGYYTPGSQKDFYSTVVLTFKYRFGPLGLF